MSTKVQFTRCYTAMGGKVKTKEPQVQTLFCCDVCLDLRLQDHFGKCDAFSPELAAAVEFVVKPDQSRYEDHEACSRVCGACEELPQNRTAQENFWAIQSETGPCWWELKRKSKWCPEDEHEVLLVLAGTDPLARDKAARDLPCERYCWQNPLASECNKVIDNETSDVWTAVGDSR